MLGSLITSIVVGLTFFAQVPGTSNYELNSYGFGSGGTDNTGTATYSLEGISGEMSADTASTTTYSAKPGFIETQQANVPTVTLTNPSNYYDKLKFVLGEEGNPSDAKYALQISTTSDFSANINYVKSDLTIGPALTLSDYQTYTTWGGASGSTIIGLSSSTTYYIRAKATQGQFTESGWGPSSTAATVGQSLSFCLYSGANCAAGGSSIAFGVLPPATVTDSPNNIGVDFATNANLGGEVYIYSQNGGLLSSAASYTLASATADLTPASEGFGAKIASVSEGSGGPLSKQSPYDGTSNNVGIVSSTIRSLLISNNPLTGGTASVQLKAKPSNATPASNDYSEILTVIAAAKF